MHSESLASLDLQDAKLQMTVGGWRGLTPFYLLYKQVPMIVVWFMVPNPCFPITWGVHVEGEARWLYEAFEDVRTELANLLRS